MTLRRFNRRYLVPAAMVAVLGMGVRGTVAEPVVVVGESMEPTVHAGDHVLMDKRDAARDAPGHGELLVLRAPDTGEVLLKRVVGTAGETVAIADGRLVVDGRAVPEAYADPQAIDGTFFGPVHVRPGTVFVLGDNRAASSDSRDFGAVHLDAVLGRVRGRIWPPQRIGPVS